MAATPGDYRIPGFRVCLVREPGVALAEKPLVQTAAAAAKILSAYIGDVDRETFVLLMLTVRKRVLGLHTVSVGCLTASLVHPRLCWAKHKAGYVAAVVMWRSRSKASGERASRPTDAT